MKRDIRAAYKVLQEFLRFILVGIVNTLCNYTSFVLLYTTFNVNYLISGAIGFLIGAYIGFTLNQRWTFKGRLLEKKLQLPRYLYTQLFCLLLHMVTQVSVINLCGISEYMSQLFGIIITTFINFTLIRFWVFQQKAPIK